MSKAPVNAGDKLSITIPNGDDHFDLTLIKPLSEGGAGYVYLAQDEIHRTLIVKVPKARKDWSFEVERAILSQVSGPNVPELMGTHKLSDGRLCLVFERLFANPIHFLNRSQARSRVTAARDDSAHYIPLPGPLALNFARELLLALENYHRLGYVHCDVKLANLMLRLESSGQELSDNDYVNKLMRHEYRGVLIDAGGVRNTDYLEDLNKDAQSTKLVPPQCTPVFAPPEVVIEPNVYSPQMDLYAAALTIYSLVTGHTPYSHCQRKLNPRDLVSVWEFKLAEKRGDISPINFEVIQNVVFSDSEFRQGADYRARFDHALHSFLSKYCCANPEDRGSAAMMRFEFDETFRVVKKRHDDPHRNLVAKQGLFDDASSSQQRMTEAAIPKASGTLAQEKPQAARADIRKLRRQSNRFKMPPAPIQRPPKTKRLSRSAGELLGSPPVTPPVAPPAQRTPLHGPSSGFQPIPGPKSSHRLRKQPAKGPKASGRLRPEPTTGRLQRGLIRPPRILEGEEREGEPMERYVPAARGDLMAFLRQYPHPFLIHQRTDGQTIAEDAPTTRVPRMTHNLDKPLVFEVKFQKGREGRSITIGRASARDVQLRFSSVSQLHAALALDTQNNRWIFSDLGSTNGSWVEDRRLMTLVPSPLESWSHLQLGSESFLFLTADGFYNYLRTLLQA